MTKKLIAKDNRGNKAYIDSDGKAMVVNKEGRGVNPKGTEEFLRSAGFKLKKSANKIFIDMTATNKNPKKTYEYTKEPWLKGSKLVKKK